MKFKDVIDKAFDVAVILSILAGVAVLISIIIHMNQPSRDSRGVCAGVIVITEQQLEDCKEFESLEHRE